MIVGDATGDGAGWVDSAVDGMSDWKGDMPEVCIWISFSMEDRYIVMGDRDVICSEGGDTVAIT